MPRSRKEKDCKEPWSNVLLEVIDVPCLVISDFVLPIQFYDFKMIVILRVEEHDDAVICAGSCADCGDNDFTYNGVCAWNSVANECQPKGVSCGGHDAGSCADCDPKKNPAICKGDCAWNHLQST